MWVTILGSLIRYALVSYLIPILVGRAPDSALAWLVGPGADQMAAGLMALAVILWGAWFKNVKNAATIAVAADSAPTTPARAESAASELSFSEQRKLAFQSPSKHPDVPAATTKEEGETL